MYVLIAGGGRTGATLALTLRAQKHDVLLIEHRAPVLAHIHRELPTELVSHFFRSLSDALKATLHVEVTGENAHHMVEACFKAVGRSLRQAIAKSGTELPSTKGVL